MSVHDGPEYAVVHHYAKSIQQEFFRSRFTGEHEERLFFTGLLSKASQEILLKKIEQWGNEFAQLQREDLAVATNKRTNIGMVIATRPWKLEEFEALERSKPDRASSQNTTITQDS